MDFDRLEKFVYEELKNDKTGHDSQHVKRVMKLALSIAKTEEIDMEVLRTAILLHDISLRNSPVKGHEITSAIQAREILSSYDFPKEKIDLVCEVIKNHNRAYGIEKVDVSTFSKEARILCDADRIDSFGAIGIIRSISFSLSQGCAYMNSNNDQVNESFYGSLKFLIHLADDMLTKEGSKIAKERVKIIEYFIGEMEKEI
ncbi:MAG: HD domain-containing protein [Nanoarchaeota archaeon]